MIWEIVLRVLVRMDVRVRARLLEYMHVHVGRLICALHPKQSITGGTYGLRVAVRVHRRWGVAGNIALHPRQASSGRRVVPKEVTSILG